MKYNPLLYFIILSSFITVAFCQETNNNEDVYHIQMDDVYNNYHYNQPYRPQFHYTPITGHNGDATGLIYYKGQYHLFYMFDPWERRRMDHKNWGYAVSNDCIYWEQKPPILDTKLDNHPGSGSGIVDWNNSSGLRRGPEKPLVVFYTDYGIGSCITFSIDGGKNWIRHKDNPILTGKDDIRDPTVFWYKPDKSWRMVRYEKKGFAFYKSENLVKWAFLSRMDGFYECPDICHLPIDGDEANKKWVLIDGNGTYLLGNFNGEKFLAETEKLHVDYGPSLYATQSWKQTYEGDGPVIQMAWMRSPREPLLTWHGQMSFPCELSLKTSAKGIRLYRYPINEIKKIRYEENSWKNLIIGEGENPLSDLQGDVFEISAQIEIIDASEVGFHLRGENLVYSVAKKELTFLETTAPLEPVANIINFKILLDRSSVEVFGNNGIVSITQIFFPDLSNSSIGLFSNGGKIKVKSMEVNRLESIWLALNQQLGHPTPLPN